jgi:hypothetical protein
LPGVQGFADLGKDAEHAVSISGEEFTVAAIGNVRLWFWAFEVLSEGTPRVG